MRQWKLDKLYIRTKRVSFSYISDFVILEQWINLLMFRLFFVIAVRHLRCLLPGLYRWRSVVDNDTVPGSSRGGFRCTRASAHWRNSRSRIVSTDWKMHATLGGSPSVVHVERRFASCPDGNYSHKFRNQNLSVILKIYFCFFCLNFQESRGLENQNVYCALLNNCSTGNVIEPMMNHFRLRSGIFT